MTRARDVANIDGILTTTGDTFYASSGGTPARLGIGSTDQVLKVSGGVPTWATPSSGDTGPSFSAYRSGSNQSITNSTFVKAQLNAEEWDTASAYDSSTNYRFTPQTAGYYNVVVSGYVNYSAADTINLFVFKNGSSYKYIAASNKANGGGTTAYGGACMVYFNGSSDYIELYLYSYNAATEIPVNALNCSFSAALVRTA